MKFRNWTLDALIEYLKEVKHAPPEFLDYRTVPRISGEIHIANGEMINSNNKTKQES